MAELEKRSAKTTTARTDGVSIELMQSTSACRLKWPDVQSRFPLLRPRALLTTASGGAVTAAVSARHHLGAWPRNRRFPLGRLTHLALSELHVNMTSRVSLQRRRTRCSTPTHDNFVIASEVTSTSRRFGNSRSRQAMPYFDCRCSDSWEPIMTEQAEVVEAFTASSLFLPLWEMSRFQLPERSTTVFEHRRTLMGL